jgi:hypothetical protein
MASPDDARTKVVIRNLPPGLTEGAFRALIDKALGGRYDWMAFYPGKVRCAVGGEGAGASCAAARRDAAPRAAA